MSLLLSLSKIDFVELGGGLAGAFEAEGVGARLNFDGDFGGLPFVAGPEAW